MRLNEVLADNLYKHRMNETVVKPYIKYLEGLGTYLKEDAMTSAQLQQMVQQSGDHPENIVLPPEVKQNFANELAKIPPGPVQNFGPQAQAEINKIQDPTVKASLLQKAKEALKNPDTQQTILSAISSIAGMAAGAATLGIGKDAAKAATQAIGNGLLGVVNARLTGKDWQSSLKHGAKHVAAHGIAAATDTDARDIKKAAGIKMPDGSTKPAEPATAQAPAGATATTPELTNKWQEFINYGQKLVQQMAGSSTATPKTA